MDLCPELTLNPILDAKAACLDLTHNFKLGMLIQKENKMAVVKLEMSVNVGLHITTIASEHEVLLSS